MALVGKKTIPTLLLQLLHPMPTPIHTVERSQPLARQYEVQHSVKNGLEPCSSSRVYMSDDHAS